MDLIFQSGEFYSQESTLGLILKLLLPLLGAVISGSIAIWIFNRGIRKRKEEEEDKKQKRLRELKEYVLTILKLLKEPIDKQIASYLKFSDDLKNPDDINYSPTYEPGLSTRNFEEVDHKDLYKIFASNKEGAPEKVRLFQTLNTQINYVRVSQKSFPKLFDYFMAKNEKYVEGYNGNMSEIGRYFDTLITNARQTKIQQGEDPFFEELGKLFHEWSQINNYRQRSIAVDKFLIPLQALCRTYNEDSRGTKILHHCNDSLYAFENIERLKRFTREGTIKMALGLRAAKKTILNFLDSTQ